jgi:hypothetical protein
MCEVILKYYIKSNSTTPYSKIMKLAEYLYRISAAVLEKGSSDSGASLVKSFSLQTSSYLILLEKVGFRNYVRLSVPLQ